MQTLISKSNVTEPSIPVRKSCRYLSIWLVFIIVLSAALVSPCYGANQLSQFGITWTFDRDYEVGQFANGDFWVVGPVTIIGISPLSTEISGRVMNGSMVNPSPTNDSSGYDTEIGGYSSPLNVALDVSSSNPLVLGSHSSLVSVISIALPDARPQLKSAAVLTVVAGPCAAGSFRPPYSGTDKTIRFNKSQLNYSLLANLEPAAECPSLSTVERTFERPWIDHRRGWGARYQHPTENMPDYGREISTHVGIGALMLHLNFTNAQKETLLIRYVQLGIDLYGIVQAGGRTNWAPDGGHASGRKWPILFGGLILGDAEMADIGSHSIDNPYFGEDSQTFYVSQEDVDRVLRVGNEPYMASDIGLAEWGIRHATYPDMDNRSWSASYRGCCTAYAWGGFVLASHIMGTQTLWNHDVLFDYMDRYMAIQEPGNRQQSIFVEYMWDMYRDDVGGGLPLPEPDTVLPLSPVDLVSTAQTTDSISLSWTAPGPAEDGDLPQSYRVLRDEVLVGSPASTSFEDISLSADNTYHYKVYSIDDAGNSSLSYAEGSLYTLAEPNYAEPNYPYTDGLVGNWRFDENTGGTAEDSSGCDNNATLLNGPVWAEGRINSAISFDGVDDAVQVPTVNWDAGTGTIALWFYANSFSAAQDYLFSHATQPWANRIQLYVKTGGLCLGLGDSHTTRLDILRLEVQRWYHIGLSWDGTNYIVYVDGTPMASGTYNGLAAINSFSDIGNNGDALSRVEALDGLIDEVRLYSRVLTESEISQLVVNEPDNADLLDHWKLDEANGSEATDSAGGENTGIIVNGPMWVDGAIDGGLQLNGTDQCVEVATELWNSVEGTVAMWVYPEWFSAGQNYLFGHAMYPWANRIQLYTKGENGSLCVGLGDSHSTELDIDQLALRVWQHVALSWCDGVYEVCIDGILAASGPFSGLEVLNGYADIGNNGYRLGRNEAFIGLLDDVRVYSCALSVDEISELASGLVQNRSPVLSVVDEQSVDENQTLTIQLHGYDPDSNDVVTYFVENPVTLETTELPDGLFSWTPTYEDAGSYNFEFIVSDGRLQDSQIVAVTVNNVNRSPVFEAIGHKTVDEGAELTFVVNATDPDGDAISYLVQNLPEGAVFSNQTFSFQPGDEQAGDYLVTFVASDGLLEDIETIVITVNDVIMNHAPVLEAVGGQSVDENQTLTIQLYGYDPDGNDVTTYFVENPITLDTTELPDGLFSWTPTYDEAGSYNFKFIISDGWLQDSQTAAIMVNNVNRSPVFEAMENKTVDEGAELTFVVNASDPDGDTISYSALNLPEGAVFSNQTFSFKPGYEQTGDYLIIFVASDGLLEDIEAIVVTVNDVAVNQAPVLEPIGNKSVDIGGSINFNINAYDADGDAISYSAQNLPVGAVLSGDNFRWTPGDSQVGNWQVTFIADDGQLQDSETIIITVLPVNGDVVLYMKCDDEPTDGVLDSSPYGNNGTVTPLGCPAWVAGRINGAYAFDGVSDNIKIADSTSLDVDSITLSAWIYVDAYKDDQRIISKEFGTKQPYSIYTLLLSGSGESKLELRVGIAETKLRQRIYTDRDIALHRWTHVAATFDGSQVVLYIDGREVKRAGVSGTIMDNDEPVYIGASQFYNRFFDGMIDEARIINRALSSREIMGLYWTNKL